MTTTFQAPELKGSGFRGGYRIYTIDHLPRHAFPTYADGGPATVTLGEWSVSYQTSSNTTGVTLNARRAGSGSPHPLSGTVYPTHDDAVVAAYNAKLIGVMLYEDQAIRDGLGIVA